MMSVLVKPISSLASLTAVFTGSASSSGSSFPEETLYRRINADLLGKSRHYLGGWYNKADDQVYLDIAQVVPLVAAALLLARENQQQAVYDLLTGEEIRLGLN